MSVNLKKGQKISLVKPGSAGLKRIMVGLGWDEVEQKRRVFFAPKPQDIDCDASVILCGANGKVISPDPKQGCVYFGNLRHSSGAIVHQGDNLTGAGEGDDEQIMVDLSNNTEICRFNLSENYEGMTGMVVGELYRHEGEWKFNAIGQAVREASRLASLIRLYI